MKLFDCQFGRNQDFNAGGNLFAAAIIAGTSHFLGNQAIFFAVAMLVLPTILATLAIKRDDIDFDLARGGCEDESLRTNCCCFARFGDLDTIPSVRRPAAPSLPKWPNASIGSWDRSLRGAAVQSA